MTSVFLTVPATGRAKAAYGVCFNEDEISKCTSPEADRSINGEIAYGERQHTAKAVQ